jgi:hypothetical protein
MFIWIVHNHSAIYLFSSLDTIRIHNMFSAILPNTGTHSLSNFYSFFFTKHLLYFLQAGDAKPNYATVRCAPGFIMNLVEKMSDAAKARVAELGFGQILELQMDGIPERTLGMFLTSRVRDAPPRLQVGRKVLPINAAAIQKVLGLPCSPEGVSFPKWTYQQKIQGRLELRRLCEERGLKAAYEKKGKLDLYNKLKPPEVPRWFLEESATSHSVPVEWAVQAFFICLSNAFLFPTTSDRIVGLDYLRCKDLDAIPSINWCQEVVKDIMEASSDWNKAIAVSPKSTPAIKGCMAFLMVCSFQQFSV